MGIIPKITLFLGYWTLGSLIAILFYSALGMAKGVATCRTVFPIYRGTILPYICHSLICIALLAFCGGLIYGSIYIYENIFRALSPLIPVICGFIYPGTKALLLVLFIPNILVDQMSKSEQRYTDHLARMAALDQIIDAINNDEDQVG